MHKLTIRLRRVGRWRKPVYAVVVMSAKKPMRGSFLEKLGFYSPLSSSKIFFINLDRLSFWLLRGAKISISTGRLLGNVMPKNRLFQKPLFLSR